MRLTKFTLRLELSTKHLSEWRISMEDENIDELFTGLLLSVPIFIRELLRIGSVVIKNAELTKPHISLLFLLKAKGPCKMSSLGKMLYVSKPNVTILVEKLVEFNMVKRTLDEKDRRLIYIEITDTGRDFLKECVESMKGVFCENIKKFSPEDLNILKQTLGNMRMFIEKMDK